MADSTCARLCGDCQRGCKQTPVAVVVSCPLYLRRPCQRELAVLQAPKR